jgi:hypothetical protein
VTRRYHETERTDPFEGIAFGFLTGDCPGPKIGYDLLVLSAAARFFLPTILPFYFDPDFD